ncbi:hypothetical protein SDC9_75513 [bioreactor metagenome]|uniref:ECF RNA polymerase sigma factor SigW n=1 Tax=bioreactor metagenome TaxID=1076179 RepID=A0A644YK65_9ZZZZ
MTKNDNMETVATAFETMYVSNFHKIRSFCFGYLRDDALAENVSQDVFVTAWSNRDSLDFGEDLLPYLFVVAKNRCLNELKRGKLRKTHSDYSLRKEKEALFCSSLKAMQLDLLYRKDLEYELNRIFDKMPRSVSSTFKLSRFGNLKYDEIAKVERISVKTVEYRIMFALRILRKSLKSHFPLMVLLGYLLFRLLYV